MVNILNFNKPKNIAQWLIFLAAIGITLSSPAGTRAFFRELRRYLAAESKKKEMFLKTAEISKAIYYLKKRKIIAIQKTSNKTTIVLTEKGRKRKLQYDFENLKILKPGSWDKKWRFLMFDVPESKKTGREALREKLKNLGFIQFQKSIWTYPYPCENEIDFIAEYFSLRPHIVLLTVQLEEDLPLRTRFNLL